MSSLNNWQLALIGWFALAALTSVALVGRERKPLTPGAAVVSMLIGAALIFVAVKA